MSRDFFKQRKRTEDIIASVSKERDKAATYKKFLIPGIIFLILSLGIGGLATTAFLTELDDMIGSISIGAAVLAFGLGLPFTIIGFVNHKKRLKLIADLINLGYQKTKLVPEKRVTFLSKVYVPLYMILLIEKDHL